MARMEARLRRKMSIKKNRFKTPQQQEEEILKKKPRIKKRAKKKNSAAKIKRVYQKKDNDK